MQYPLVLLSSHLALRKRMILHIMLGIEKLVPSGQHQQMYHSAVLHPPSHLAAPHTGSTQL